MGKEQQFGVDAYHKKYQKWCNESHFSISIFIVYDFFFCSLLFSSEYISRGHEIYQKQNNYNKFSFRIIVDFIQLYKVVNVNELPINYFHISC